MAGALFHYKQGPASYTAAGLILGGQLVQAATGVGAPFDVLDGIGVMVAASGSITVLGVAGADANTGMIQVTGASPGEATLINTPGVNANDPVSGSSLPAGWPGDGSNANQDQLLDQSILDYTIPVYNNVDINVTYAGAASFGELLVVGATAGTVAAYTAGTSTYDKIVGRCTQPGGMSAAGVGRAFIRV